MTKGKTRTRFAPSPTGYMHVGNLRTALYAYLLAKAENGTFILRIEDTDQVRQVEGATDIIYNTLRDTELLWDEGPDIGGPVGPYVQSERRAIYKEWAEKLVELGHAYYCFCDEARLEEMRTIQKASGMTPKYDGCCRNLSKEEVKEKLNSGVPYVIRQKIPETGETTYYDEVFGSITTLNETLDDNVLLKADGLPTYNFANVIDDHLMDITHVIRGTEYLSSAPKYTLLYQAYGWEVPKYIHCPPVMKDEQHKLSKRNGDASYQDLIEKGFLKDAILNYIALLGWSPKGEEEIFTLEEMKEIFSVEGISKSPAIFDTKKLRFVNQEYIKRMDEQEWEATAMPYIRQGVKREDVNFSAIAKVLHARTEILSEIPEQLDFIDKLPEYDVELFTHKKMKTNSENALLVLEKILPKLEAIDENNFTHDPIYETVTETIKELEVKNGVVFYPLRVATSGKAFTPGGGVEIAEIIGKKDTIERVKSAIEKLK